MSITQNSTNNTPAVDTNPSLAGITAGVTVENIGGATQFKTIVTLTNVTIPLTDYPAIGASAGALLFTFPNGGLSIVGTNTLTINKDSAGVSDTWSGNYAFGTVITTTGDLSGAGEAQFVGPNTIGPAVAGLNNINGQLINGFIAEITDLSTTISPIGRGFCLNLMVNAADETVAITPCNLIINGTITVVWSNLGDY